MSVMLDFYNKKAADLSARIDQLRTAAVGGEAIAIAEIGAAERQLAYIEGEVRQMVAEQSLAEGASRR